jgi:hypothetical protein
MAQMSDLIFNAPAGSNLRLQGRFDRPARVIADLTDKDSLKALENTSVNTSAPEIDRRFRLNIPSIIERLKEYGIKVDPENYKNLRDLIFGEKGIKEGIETAYENQGLGTLVPQGKKKGDVALVGVNPKGVSGKKRLQLLKKRFDKILEDQVLYEKSNGKFGKPIMRQGGEGTEGGFIAGLQDGGEVKPVRMAIGGDPLQNINQQQFTPDPAIDDDYFQQAVDSGNLMAFNPFKLFRLFGKVDAVQTPKKITAPKEVDAPEGTTLPATQEIQPQDFPFKSFTLESIMDPNAPKADQPQGWANFLFKGKNVPKSELNDSGLTQFLTDYEKYFPGQKVTQQQLIDYYETSPIGNLSFKVKDEARREISNPQYDQYAGRPRHQDAGNQPLDSQGEDYREIVVEAGPLPGEKKPFVQSGHYQEPNVIGFTRVANYTQPDGKRVAVIQEMQTDMLSKVRKEQERLRAFMTRLENVKQKADETIRRGDDGYYTQRAQDALRDINNKYPPSVMKALEENASLIKPFPNQAAASTIPTYSKQLQELQSQIDQIVKSDLQQSKPETVFQIREISEKQGEVLNSLLDLNRSGQLDNILKDIKIPSSSSTEDLNRFALGDDSFQVEENYGGKALELFPPIPFNKQPDYVDLLIKATIKDAQSKGINKVAIYPPDLVNNRWGKTPGGSSAKKFEDLYGKVAVQQMKNIAKKYDGVAKFEFISDTTKPPKGLEIYSKGVDGQAQLTNKIIASNRESGPGLEKYLDSEIRDLAMDYEPNQVVLSREVAPGQKMEYFVNYNNSKNNFDLVALGSEDKADDALILIQEFNPQEVPMFTITLDSPKAEQPMYLFKKKDGGSIAKDSLVSVTDIYGEYGR